MRRQRKMRVRFPLRHKEYNDILGPLGGRPSHGEVYNASTENSKTGCTVTNRQNADGVVAQVTAIPT